jgi:hypothetical protein
VEAVLAPVADRVVGMCAQFHGDMGEVATSTIVSAACFLSSKRILLADPGCKRLRMRIALNVPADDIRYALSNDKALDWLQRLNL